MGKVLILVGLVFLVMSQTTIVKGGLVCARIKNRTAAVITMAVATVLLISGGLISPQPITRMVDLSQPIGAAVSSLSVGASASVIGSAVFITTPVLPSRVITQSRLITQSPDA